MDFLENRLDHQDFFTTGAAAAGGEVAGKEATPWVWLLLVVLGELGVVVAGAGEGGEDTGGAWMFASCSGVSSGSSSSMAAWSCSSRCLLIAAVAFGGSGRSIQRLFAPSLKLRENIARGRMAGGDDEGEEEAADDEEEAAAVVAGETAADEEADEPIGEVESPVLDWRAPHRVDPPDPLAVGRASARAALVTTGRGELGGVLTAFTWPRL